MVEKIKPDQNLNELFIQNKHFYPKEFLKSGTLFSAQGRNTITDEQILRSSNSSDPVQLIVRDGKVIVFEGNHRVCWSIFTNQSMAYELLPEETKTPHIYPFRLLYNEFKRRIGRIDL